MLTRSVVACILSGTLVSSMLLGGPLATAVHAKKIEVKRTTKASRGPTCTRKAAASPRYRRTASSHVRHPRAVAGTGASRTASSSLQRKPNRAAAIHLGTFTVRAYTRYPSPGVAPSKTATGTTPTAGRTVAVDPRVIPLGSKIHIEGVGERIAEDTGGKIKGKRLDLFLPSPLECRQFGVQTQEVHLLVD